MLYQKLNSLELNYREVLQKKKTTQFEHINTIQSTNDILVLFFTHRQQIALVDIYSR